MAIHFQEYSEMTVYEHTTTRSEPRRGGFECEFVQEPSKEIQTKCLLCTRVLCDPYQVSCCGNNFCKTCIEQIPLHTKPCPVCCEEDFTTTHNEGLQKSLHKLCVYCTHKQQGCEWTGELGQLDKHLNLNPQPDDKLDGCQYSEIECNYCGEMAQRHTITTHQADLCLKRPFICQYCHNYESNYDEVIYDHWRNCPFLSVQCPRECGIFLPREKMDHHLEHNCPLTVIDCDFHHVGCNVKLPRKDMPTHLNECNVTHMSLDVESTHRDLLISHTKLQTSLAELRKRVKKLEIENQSLREENQKLLKMIRESPQRKKKVTFKKEVAHVHTVDDSQLSTKEHPPKSNQATQESLLNPPSPAKEDKEESHIQPETDTKAEDPVTATTGYAEFTMHDYKRHKKNDTKWFSQPFYTSPQGYQMCLKVHANGTGSGKATHVSVFIHLMRGDFDNNLKWPFRGDITIQLLNQGEDREHYSKTVPFNENAPNTHAGRVKDEARNRKGWGFAKYISHDELQPNYLKEDSLRFRVVATVTVNNTFTCM